MLRQKLLHRANARATRGIRLASFEYLELPLDYDRILIVPPAVLDGVVEFSKI